MLSVKLLPPERRMPTIIARGSKRRTSSNAERHMTMTKRSAPVTPEAEVLIVRAECLIYH